MWLKQAKTGIKGCIGTHDYARFKLSCVIFSETSSQSVNPGTILSITKTKEMASDWVSSFLLKSAVISRLLGGADKALFNKALLTFSKWLSILIE